MYSRRQTVEEKNNRRKAVGFALLSIGFLLFAFFYGLPLLVRISGIAYDFRKSSQSIEITDKTPPSPPRLAAIEKATNKKNIEIKGFAESGSTVGLDINGTEEEVVVNTDGEFSISVSLSNGDNFIYAFATDSSGNKSQNSDTVTVVYDTEPPSLTIENPADNSEFYGLRQKQVNISGKSEPESQVQINDRLAIVDSEGKFNFAFTLQDGKNIITVKTTDLAGNITEQVLTVTFSP